MAGLLALSACGDSDGDSPFENGEQSGEESGGSGEETGGEGEEGGGESIADLPADQIMEQAQEALLAAESLRMTTEGGPGTDGVGMDLHLDKEGSCEGWVSMEGQGSVEILMRADQIWMKPDQTFWSTMGASDPALVSLVDGNWLYGTTDDPELASTASACALGDLFAGSGSGGTDTATIGEETTHNGTPVIEIHDTDETGAEMTMLIATEGEPYPLLMTTNEGGGTTELEISDFNVPVSFDEPAADVVLNIEDFRSGNITA
ncbi:hypothetical protein D7319_11050 [Streptomyces radicis]|uniref:Lipoprotein n=2 Tax=Streptomyces radicis TaxID=1750517 RepID=A0A3A9WU19_9ACTN|nr:hypothetical protein D7319_11050 [Streptomyces radicis]RKN23276.1 hypothetical protein D7318_12230 [Streptomyces radicis]